MVEVIVLHAFSTYDATGIVQGKEGEIMRLRACTALQLIKLGKVKKYRGYQYKDKNT